MQSGADFIDRTIAALEGGPALPEDIAGRLLNACLEYRDKPGASLDKLLGLKPGRGQRSIASCYRDQHCARKFREFYKAHYEGVKPTPAAQTIDCNFNDLAKNRDDPDVDQYHKELYDEIMSVKGKVPKSRMILHALQSNE